MMSKMLKNMVAIHQKCHPSTHRLHNNHQSTHHSRETAVLKAHCDITEVLDNKCMAAMVLLDLLSSVESLKSILEVLYPGFSAISATESSVLE